MGFDPLYRSGVVGLLYQRVDVEARGEFELFQACELEPEPTEPIFLRGDSNHDGDVNIADPIFVLNWLFGGGPGLACLATANVNGDDAVDVSDPTYLLNHLFGGGPAPAEPFPACGTSAFPEDEELGCDAPPEDC